ncbi:MAG: hypothetical protein IKM53_03360 [Clostridia bacterium]|nr:hypothetical protein [Clostridia bacterium]
MNKRIFSIFTLVLLSVFVFNIGITVFATETGAEASTEEAADILLSVTDGSDSVSEETVEDATELSFSTDNISKTLPVMGYGMLGIFIVIIIIGVVVVALNKLFPPKAGE